MVLFILLYKVVLTFESVDGILKCDDSNESFRAVLFCGAVLIICCTRCMVLTFGYVGGILKCDDSNESFRAVLFCGAVYFVVQGGSNF